MPSPPSEIRQTAPRPSAQFLGLLGFALALAAAGVWFGVWSGWGKDPFFGFKALGVPALEFLFYDLDTGCRAAVYAGQGYNPYMDGSYNSRGILANYPPALLWVMSLLCDLFRNPYNAGWVLVGTTLFLFGLLSTRLSFLGGICLGLGLGLGGPALALERGNSDLIILPLAALAVWLPWRLERIHPWAGLAAFALLILLGCMLKLFPLLAIGGSMIFKNRRDRWLAALLATAACAFYIIYDYALITTLLDNTPISSLNSYGLQTIALFLTLDNEAAAMLRAGLIIAANGVAYVVFMSLFSRRTQPQPPHLESTRRLLLYGLCLVGAGIFCGTYLVSANFLYRLVFPLMCLPYLFHQRAWAYRAAACGLTVFAIWPFLEATGRLFFWGSRIQAVSFFLQQSLGLVLAGAALGWLVWQAFTRLFAEERPVAVRRGRTARG